MLELLTLPRIITFLASSVLSLCVLAQTITAVASYFRYPRNRARNCETVLELLILCHIMLCALLHVQAEEEFKAGSLTPPEYTVFRWIIFALIVSAVIIVTVYAKKPGSLPVILASGFTLPFVEQMTGYAFVYMNLSVILFWLVRSIVYSLFYRTEIRSGLSALSVKKAIDSMITGVMFCQPDGSILLVNKQMQYLMKVITGKTQRNGRHFYSLLTLGDINSECDLKLFGEQSVIILPDDTAWQFSIAEISIGKKKYFQLNAIEISELWNITSKLHPQNDKLLQRQSELNETIENLNLLSRERETQKAKMRAHDILGERLAVLQAAVFGNQTLDHNLLRSLSQELLDDLKNVSNDPAPQDELDSLQQIFRAIDVEVRINGRLPEDAEKGHLFVEIVREAVNNAVRHGLATQIEVTIDDPGSSSNLMITDNGYPPINIKEGGGISSMRKKLEAYDGTLEISKEPQFTLTVKIPGGKENDQSTDC